MKSWEAFCVPFKNEVFETFSSTEIVFTEFICYPNSNNIFWIITFLASSQVRHVHIINRAYLVGQFFRVVFKDGTNMICTSNNTLKALESFYSLTSLVANPSDRNPSPPSGFSLHRPNTAAPRQLSAGLLLAALSASYGLLLETRVASLFPFCLFCRLGKWLPFVVLPPVILQQSFHYNMIHYYRQSLFY